MAVCGNSPIRTMSGRLFLMCIILLYCCVLPQGILGQDKVYDFDEEEAAGSFVGNVARDLNLEEIIAPGIFNSLRYRKYNIVVNLRDINDNAPKFNQTTVTLKIPESVTVGKKYSVPGAFDDDRGPGNSIQSYSFQPPRSTFSVQYFQVSPKTGELSAKVVLTSGSYVIIVEAVDQGSPERVNQTEVVVSVMDTDNNPPVITVDPLSPGSDSARIKEDAKINALVAHVTVFDPDSGQNGAVKCYSQSAFFDLYELEDNNYKVVVAQGLDREVTDLYRVTLFCEDSGSPRLNATQVFDVIVEDVNDNAPRFQDDDVTIEVQEGNAIDDVAMVILASDLDSGDNAKIYFTLLEDSDGFFRVPINSNTLVCAKELDRETQDVHVITVLAKDAGKSAQSTTATVTVSVSDVNDNEPRFFKSKYRFSVMEGLDAGSVVGAVSATDRDLGDGGKVRFSLPSWSQAYGKFRMLDNGTLTTATRLDRESEHEFTFRVEAADRGSPSLTSQVEVKVEVKDTNDNNPIFLFPSPSNSSVTLVLPVDNSKSLMRIQVTDADQAENGEVHFSLLPGNASLLFFLDTVTGELFASRDLEAGDEGVYNLSITATDRGVPPLSTTRNLLLTVMVNPVSSPVSSTDSNAMIALGLVCGTMFLAAIIVLVVCFLRRRDRNRKLRYLDNKGKNSAPRVLDAAALPHEYDVHKEANNNNIVLSTPGGEAGLGAYSKYSVPKLSVGYPNGSAGMEDLPDKHNSLLPACLFCICGGSCAGKDFSLTLCGRKRLKSDTSVVLEVE
ncbi:protocadherin-7-like [Aplysia californica]|uniref:Protocadherin-7-like n=1 Tax=Aplysia californica TaxID=6500 RepID=A0ABM1A171_APLCA|nr:protocadherin-7-like [Aplysia californica]